MNKRYKKRGDEVNREKFGISLPKESLQILDSYCKRETRNRSNMIEVMIKAYDEVHKTKY